MLTPVTCIIGSNCLNISRNGRDIGKVEDWDGEFVIVMNYQEVLTFDDIAIIQDNWNVMREIQRNY